MVVIARDSDYKLAIVSVFVHLSRTERDRAADQPAEERGEKDAASREGEKRGVSGRHWIAVPLRSHLSRDLCPPRGSRESANGEQTSTNPFPTNRQTLTRTERSLNKYVARFDKKTIYFNIYV